MIKLISGATCINGRMYRPEDGPFEADPQIEERLVRRGVAVYISKSLDAFDTSGTVSEPPAQFIATNGETVEDRTEAYIEPSEQSYQELRSYAKELGIDVKRFRSKAALEAEILRFENAGPDLTGMDDNIV